MALETLQGVMKTPSGLNIIDMNALKNSNPELFPNGNQMDYKVFEETIRPHNFIYVRHDVNSLSFTFQNGPVKENGVNGCQVTDILEVVKVIFEGLNEQHPHIENALTVAHIEAALEAQRRRTADREARGVEGTSQN